MKVKNYIVTSECQKVNIWWTQENVTFLLLFLEELDNRRKIQRKRNFR